MIYHVHNISLQGTIKDLAKHAKEYTAYHTQLLKVANKEMKAKTEQQMASLSNIAEGLKAELRAAKSEILSGMQSLESRISQALQERFRDVQLTYQYYYQQFQADERTLGYQTLYWTQVCSVCVNFDTQYSRTSITQPSVIRNLDYPAWAVN